MVFPINFSGKYADQIRKNAPPRDETLRRAAMKAAAEKDLQSKSKTKVKPKKISPKK